MPGSIVQSLEEAARNRPDSPALAWRDTRWSYSDLLRAVISVKAKLATCAVPRGTRVALLLRNSPHYVALYYAILASGCTVVPLNTQERACVLARQIENCGSALLFGDPAHPEWIALRNEAARLSIQAIDVPLSAGQVSIKEFTGAMGFAGDDYSRSLSGSFGNDDEPALIIYTSGTTGRPKGVMLSHHNLQSNAEAIVQYLGLNAADRGLCVLPFHFSYGNSVLNSHLMCGAFLAIEENLAYPHLILQRLHDDAITGFAGVPSTFALLLHRCRLNDFDLSRLRYVTQAGGAMARPLIERLHEQVPGVRIFIMYGQTEATARLTYLPPERMLEKIGSVGIPIPGVQIEVRVEDQPVPAGVSGEICARGPNVMIGYWNDAAATAEVLHNEWLRTGDLGYLDEEGYLYIDGRKVEMIKVGAFRVSPLEIEEAIAQIDGVEEVAVTSIPDELLGQSIKAVIVPCAGSRLEILSVKSYCRQQLAAYKVPRIIEFASKLPRTASGKIQRFKLA